MQRAASLPDARTPPIWVLGTYSMTGGVRSCHLCGIVAQARGAGADVTALSFVPGGFAQTDVTRLPEGLTRTPPDGVLHLRAVLRLSGKGGRLARLRQWAARMRALAALLRCSRRVVIVTDTTPGPSGRVLQPVLAYLLCRLPAWAHVTTLALPPALLLQNRLGRGAAPRPPERAEGDVFAFIQSHGGPGLTLAPAHVDLALSRATGLSADQKQDIGALCQLARGLAPGDVDLALRHATHPRGRDASRAVTAAYAPGTRWPELPRIAEHLRLIGKRKRAWMRFVPPVTPRSFTAPGLGPAILRHLAGQARAEDARWLAPLSAPLVSGGGMSRLEWVLVHALRLTVPDHGTLGAPWMSAELRDQVRALVPDRTRPAPGGRPELTLTGIAGNGTGLAQNFWMSAHAMRAAGVPLRLAPTDSAAQDVLPMGPEGTPPRLPTRDVTLHHLNADRIPQGILSAPQTATRLHIGFLLWELDRLPPAHALALDMLDEIWVPSVFLKRLYQSAFERNVILMRKGLHLPPPIRPGAGPLPGDGPHFITCFDQRSGVARKNPLAAVRAFVAAFPKGVDARLTIKTTPPPNAGWGDGEGQMAAIRAHAQADPRIRLIEAYVPFPELLGLISEADALLSPHRAEGFGYLPAFALSLGVPVMTTDYGGPRDFCTPSTATLLPYRLTAVPASQTILRTPGARWADVDPDALIEAMRDFAANPAPARAGAERGKLLMQADYSIAAQARRYTARLEQIGALAPLAHKDLPLSARTQA